MITDHLREFAHAYPELKTNPFSHTDLTRLITEVIPNQLRTTLGLSNREYLLKGSVGNGEWAEIPWIAIMHRGVTTSAQNGYYSVILLSKNLDKAYIALGLGWTQFAESKRGKEIVELYAKKLVDYLSPGPKDIIGRINLSATTSRGKGYEHSNIISSEVAIDNLNDDQLIKILARHLDYYKQLRHTFGADLFYGNNLGDLPASETEEHATQKVKELSISLNKAKALRKLQSIADTLPPEKRRMYISRIIRNKAFADFVKQRANYVCEICGRIPFKKKSEQPYAEADHIDPLYVSGVDHPDNMRCLCAQCHRVITYGSKPEILKLTKSA